MEYNSNSNVTSKLQARDTMWSGDEMIQQWRHSLHSLWVEVGDDAGHCAQHIRVLSSSNNHREYHNDTLPVRHCGLYGQSKHTSHIRVGSRGLCGVAPIR